MTDHATIPEAFHDILVAPGAGTLTTNGPDGYPQSTAVWYLFDAAEGVLRVTMRETTQKARNLGRDARCSFLLIDPADTGRAIELRGRAELHTERAPFDWAERIVGHYGSSMAEMGSPEVARVIATIRPERVNAHGG